MSVTMVESLNTALADSLDRDDRVLVFGEDIGPLGGVFRVTDGLQDRFGKLRCFDTPLAESAIVGMAIGLAMRGFRPVPEIQFDGFSYPAFEQIISHLAKYRNRTRGSIAMPVTIRIPSFGGVGAIEHHSESPETYFAHTAGLKVVCPSNPADAYSLLTESIASDDPVIFLEPKRRYWTKQDVSLPAKTASLGQATVARAGTDITVVTYGTMVGVALEAASISTARGGPSLEVIDLRSLVPLDEATVLASVTRTGRCIVAHEAPRTLGFGAEVAAFVQEQAFYSLEAPVLRATGYDTPNPPPTIESHWLPDAGRILELADQAMRY